MAKSKEPSAKLYYDTFTTPQGKLVLEDLRAYCDGESYLPGREVNEVLWREGSRRVYRRILAMIENHQTGRPDVRDAEL